MKTGIDRFLGSDEFTKPTEEIIALAKKLQEKTELKTIENILSYLKNNLKYVNLEEEDPEEWKKIFKKRAAEDILISKRAYGCGDYSVLFATLIRGLNIPAQFIEGKRLVKSGGHTWVKVFVDNKWIDIDPSNGTIGTSPENANHGPYVILSKSLGPSDGAMPSYEVWLKIEEHWQL
jgi:transglutaminase-like putative cysteine protease